MEAVRGRGRLECEWASWWASEQGEDWKGWIAQYLFCCYLDFASLDRKSETMSKWVSARVIEKCRRLIWHEQRRHGEEGENTKVKWREWQNREIHVRNMKFKGDNAQRQMRKYTKEIKYQITVRSMNSLHKTIKLSNKKHEQWFTINFLKLIRHTEAASNRSIVLHRRMKYYLLLLQV